MHQSSNPTRPTMRNAGLPFSGLGHDLNALRGPASCLRLCPASPGKQPRRWPPRPKRVPSVQGYERLVALGREIRGR